MSKVCALYHIVINTRFRKRTIPEAYKKELYMYMYGIIQNNKCKLLRMNGIANHIHMLVDLHPSISLSSLMQSLKQSSSKWMKCNEHFAYFEGWGKEYFAFSVGRESMDDVIQYIRNQEDHHLGNDGFDAEIQELCVRYGIELEETGLT